MRINSAAATLLCLHYIFVALVPAPTPAATFHVNIGTDGNDADLNDGRCDADPGTSGDQCTFRAAIQQTNAIPGTDNIFFNLPTGITPTQPVLSFFSALPNVTDTAIIDASTQPIFGRVEVNGTFAGAGAKGLVIEGQNTVVRYLTINRFLGSGIVLRGTGHVVENCIIGLNSGGTIVRPNGIDGIQIENGSNMRIGGVLPGQRNIISGNNRNGILIIRTTPRSPMPTGNVIEGNIIGLNAAGTVKLPNAVNGILLSNGLNTRIGNAGETGGNVISGNNGAGIRLGGDESDTTNTLIYGNLIGADKTGFTPLGNAASGILIEGAGSTLIGDDTTSPGLAPGNVIADNQTGITLQGANGPVRIRGNSIGAARGGSPPLPNAQDGIRAAGLTRNVVIGSTQPFRGNIIAFNGGRGVGLTSTALQVSVLRNAIFQNGLLGIDLGVNGPTPNDIGDLDVGANLQQNYPEFIIAGTRAGRLRVDGRLQSTPNENFRLEFFANEQCDPVGFGEGEKFLGDTNVRTRDDGETIFSVYLTQPSDGDVITATATAGAGHTSEFTPCEPIVEIDIEGMFVR